MWLDGKSCSAANHKPSFLSQPAHQSCKIQPICVCVCVLFFFANLGSSLERRGKFGALNNSNVNILNNITPPVSRKDRSRFVKYFIRVFEMFTNILVFCNFIANICSTSMNFSPKVNVHRKPQNNFIKSYNLSYYNVHFLTQYDL